jgi:hypothetical protein
MAEKIFDAQNNYGWGLTLNMTGKAPAISKRIFDTLADAQAFADDYKDTAIEGLVLTVVADDEAKNGVYYIKSIKTSADGEPAVLVKAGDTDMAKVEQYVGEEVLKLTNVDTTIRKEFADADKAIMETIADNELVTAEALTNLNDRVVINTDDIKDIQDYTINNKKISESPVLNSNDILIGDDYTVLSQPAENVVPGDIITTAISKLEVMLANTTLAITAALNDLDSRLGTPSSYDDEGNKHEATGLWKKVEDLEQLINDKHAE